MSPVTIVYIFLVKIMIDWLTLRLPFRRVPFAVREVLFDNMAIVIKKDCKGKTLWEKLSIDLDAIGSDFQGLFVQLVNNGKDNYLQIGASPASVNQFGLNVFGSLDMKACACVLIARLENVFSCDFPLLAQWELRRMDITFNFYFETAGQVKQALHVLLSTNAPRRRADSRKNSGDSVYWKGQLMSGKAYHKGPQLAALQSKGEVDFTAEQINLSMHLLRLELQVNSAWFRRHVEGLPDLLPEHHDCKVEGFYPPSMPSKQDKLIWQDFTPEFLTNLHTTYFSAFIGSDKVVTNMETLLTQLENVTLLKGGEYVRVSPNQAMQAHNFFMSIKENGYEQVKARYCDNRLSTFYRLVRILKAAGFSSADLSAGKILPLRAEKRLVMSQPVQSWEHLRNLTKQASNDALVNEVHFFKIA